MTRNEAISVALNALHVSRRECRKFGRHDGTATQRATFKYGEKVNRAIARLEFEYDKDDTR